MEEYYFSVSTDSGSMPDQMDWLRSIEPIGCKCGYVSNPRPLNMELTWESAAPLMHIQIWEGEIVRGEFVGVIQERVFDYVPKELFEKVFYLGKVSFCEPRKRGHHEFVSLVPKSNDLVVQERGGTNFRFERCELCSFYEYGVLEPPELYILSDQVNDRLPIYPERCGSLAVDEATMKLLNIPIFKKLRFDKRLIRDEPIDGLPHDLSTLGKDFRRKYDFKAQRRILENEEKEA